MPASMLRYSLVRLVEPSAIIPPEPAALATLDGERFVRQAGETFDAFLARVLDQTGEGVILFEEVNRDTGPGVVSMLYSGRHAEALRAAYLRIFGQPVPDDVLQAAADNGTLYRLLEAIDRATDSRRPIEDWRDYVDP